MLQIRLNIILFVVIFSGCATISTEEILTAAEQGQVNVLETLLAKGASVDSDGYRGRTLLQLALWRDKTDAAKLLIKKGADVNAYDNDDWTPLHFAARYSTTLELTDLLIKKGANVNARANHDNYKTPLDVAAYQEYGDEIALLLMENGATGEIKTKGVYKSRLDVAKSVLNKAKQENDMDVLIRLKNLYPSTPIAALISEEIKLQVNKLNTHQRTLTNLKKKQNILRKKMGMDVNSIVYVTNTDNNYIAKAMGSLQLALDASGFDWSKSLVPPTVWIFGSVPDEYFNDVKKGGAYFRKSNKWEFITLVDTHLSMKDAASLFGVIENKNSTFFSLE